MFKNYITTALRAMFKYKLYAFINIFGLAMGLSTFIAANILANYEESHDTFFANSERIYAPFAMISPEAGLGMTRAPSVQSIVGTLLQSEAQTIEYQARLISDEVLVRSEDDKFFETIRFADPDFLNIFQFDFVSGDPTTALSDPSGMIISENFAHKVFGDEPAIGKILSIDNKTDLRVTAVIKEIPKNSHLQSNFMIDGDLQIIATVAAYNKITDFDVAGDWNSLSGNLITYILAKPGMSKEDIKKDINSVLIKHMPKDTAEMITGFDLRRLVDMNLMIWDVTGLPVLVSIQLLGALILIIAVLNYTNLATAQTMGRMKEVGMRKALGASKKSLFLQFIIESIVTAFLGLIIAITLLEFLIPMINNAANKAIQFNYFSNPILMAKLLGITVFVGLLAGGYPSLMISKINPSRILSGTHTKGAKGSLLRSALLVIQFTISIFMMTAVAIIFMQNKQIEKSGSVFAKDQIYTISRMENADISSKKLTLKNEFETIDGVLAVSMTNQLPFQQNQSWRTFTKVSGDEAGKFDLQMLSIDEGFTTVFDIPIIAGRTLSRDFANDRLVRDDEGEWSQDQDSINILINEKAAAFLGYANSNDAVGQSFYSFDPDGPSHNYKIVGIVGDNNFMGFFNEIKSYFFINDPSQHRFVSLRLKAQNISNTVSEIGASWDRVVQNYPIDARFLDSVFEDIYQVFKGINAALAGFAVIAVILALIGLFGLAAFMAEKRTREIGLRKVMGANIWQIARLLIWQFSRPVFIGLFLALPLGYFGSTVYLDFFSDRIDLSIWLFVLVGFVSLVLSWGTVSAHAYRVARANPINALRYE